MSQSRACPLPQDKIVLNNGTIEQLGTASSLLLGSAAGTHIKCGVDSSPTGEVTCVKCGWVHMAYTRAEAQAEVDQFNSWFVQQTDEVKEHFGSKQSKIENYEGCDRCGGTAFRTFKAGDCPDGVTIGPVIINGMLDATREGDGCPN